MSIFTTIASAISSVVGGAVKPILDKIVGDKMSDSEKALIAFEVQKAANEAVIAEQGQFNQFVIEHSGAAKDMPRSIQILRGTVRPVITYVAFAAWCFTVYYYFTGSFTPTGPDPELALKMVTGLNGLTLGFWFYSKNKERTGSLMDIFKKE